MPARIFFVFLLTTVIGLANLAGARAASEQQDIIDKATMTVRKLLADPEP